MNDDQIYEVEECMLTGAAKTITNTEARNKTTFGRCIFRSALADLFFCEVFQTVFGVGLGLIK